MAHENAERSQDAMTVEAYALYQLEDGTVVRVVGTGRETYTLARFSDGRQFTVKRDGFERLVREGYVQAVEPTGWRVVGDEPASVSA